MKTGTYSVIISLVLSHCCTRFACSATHALRKT